MEQTTNQPVSPQQQANPQAPVTPAQTPVAQGSQAAVTSGQTTDTPAQTPQEQPTEPKVEKKAPKKKAKKVFSAEEIQAQSINIVKVTGALATFLLLFNVLALLLSRTAFDQVDSFKTQIVTTQNQSVDLQNSVGFLESQQDEIDLINNALPNEATLVDFIQTLEAIASSNATSYDLNFNALSPTGGLNQKFIPFSLSMTTDMPNFQDFLAKLEKLPYLVEVNSIKTNNDNLPIGLWAISINAKVFVQDPFEINNSQGTTPALLNIGS